jgi:diguanylate cyclase (GGDEF)-like protein
MLVNKDYEVLLANEAVRIGLGAELAKFESEENQPSGKLTISIGVATYPSGATSKDMLIKSADNALYTAKHNGKNRVEIFVATDQPSDDLNLVS